MISFLAKTLLFRVAVQYISDRTPRYRFSVPLCRILIFSLFSLYRSQVIFHHSLIRFSQSDTICAVVFNTERSKVEVCGNGRVVAMSNLGPEKDRGVSADTCYGNADVEIRGGRARAMTGN